jgi:hypothetical protein
MAEPVEEARTTAMQGERRERLEVGVAGASAAGMRPMRFGVTGKLVLGEGVRAGVGAQQTKIDDGEGIKVGKSNEGRGWRGSTVEVIKQIILCWSVESRLRESKTKLNVEGSEGEHGVSGFGIDDRPKSKIQNTRRTASRVKGLWGELAISVTKAKTGKVADGKEVGFYAGRDSTGVEGRIVRTSWNVGKGSNQLSGTVYRGVLQ